jgi:cardiolipin synthase (CMP-forming)
LTSRILTIPNILTLARLVAVPVFLWASFDGRFMLAFVLFISAALTDLFDGFIARAFNQRSRLGALLDPAADKVIMICGYLFYTLHPSVQHPIPAWLTFTTFIRDFFILFVVYLLYTRVHVKRFPPSWAGKTSTVAQAITLGAAVGVNASLPQLQTVVDFFFRATLVITLYSGWDYLMRGRRLLDEENPGAYNPRLAAGAK